MSPTCHTSREVIKLKVLVVVSVCVIFIFLTILLKCVVIS